MGWVARDRGLKAITISIRERAGAGTFDMSGMRRTMMFGDESEQSTGATSYSVTEIGFVNVHHRLEEGPESAPALLLLDEPEMGLSEGYTAAMGQYLAQAVQALPPRAPGVVVTHSKALVREMLAHLDTPPHFAHTGEDQTLDAWLSTPERRTVEDLKGLSNVDHQGRRAWDGFLQVLRERREAQAAAEAQPPALSTKPEPRCRR